MNQFLLSVTRDVLAFQTKMEPSKIATIRDEITTEQLKTLIDYCTIKLGPIHSNSILGKAEPNEATNHLRIINLDALEYMSSIILKTLNFDDLVKFIEVCVDNDRLQKHVDTFTQSDYICHAEDIITDVSVALAIVMIGGYPNSPRQRLIRNMFKRENFSQDRQMMIPHGAVLTVGYNNGYVRLPTILMNTDFADLRLLIDTTMIDAYLADNPDEFVRLGFVNVFDAPRDPFFSTSDSLFFDRTSESVLQSVVDPADRTGEILSSNGIINITRNEATVRLAKQVDRWDPLIKKAAKRHGIPAMFIKACIYNESFGDDKAVSPAGARGLMQLMPNTMAGLQGKLTTDANGVKVPTADFNFDDAFIPEINVDLGSKYLTEQWKFVAKYSTNIKSRVSLMYAAYNAGPGSVQKAKGKVPNYPETQAYVQKMLKLLGNLNDWI